MSAAQSRRGAPGTAGTFRAGTRRGQSTPTAQAMEATMSPMATSPAHRVTGSARNRSMRLFPRTATMIPPAPMMVAAFWSANLTSSCRFPWT